MITSFNVQLLGEGSVSNGLVVISIRSPVIIENKAIDSGGLVLVRIGRWARLWGAGWACLGRGDGRWWSG